MRKYPAPTWSRIKSQDLRREAPYRQQKQCCQHTPADKAYIQTAPRLGVLLRTQELCDQNAGIAGGAVPQDFKAADGSPCPERRILMNGGQSGNAFPACQCIIKANDLHILRDADALSLQKSHKFQRIVVGHRKYRRDFFRKKAGKVLTVKRHSLPCRSRDLSE